MASPSYISPLELTEAYDRKLIEQLSSDNTGLGSISTDNPLLVTAIERASEDVQLAATVGERYTVEELDALQSGDRWSLKGLVADLAIGHLYERRGGDIPASIERSIARAAQTLKSLRMGDVVFPIEADRAAGKPKVVQLGTSPRSRFRMVSDTEFFPDRRTELI